MTPHVLVVDDTPGNRYAVSRLLRGAGMRVSEAASGEQALRQVADVPDLVVLDINLPDMTGYEVCRRIKTGPNTAFIPVLHISASYTAIADRAFGLEAGADAYLTHPLEPELFIATVRALLRTVAAEAESRRTAREWSMTFDAMRDPMFVVWSSGTVKRCNIAAAALAHATVADLIGQVWTDVATAIGADASSVIRDITQHAMHGQEVQLGGRWYRVTTTSADDGGTDGSQPEEFVVCSLADVTDRHAAEQERARLLLRSEKARVEADSARGEAEMANRAKADFLAVMSHELRTPLNAIGGFAELIALGVRGPVTTEQLHDLGKIRRSQITLMALINDLLGFAKLESGSVEYSIVDVKVDDVIDAATELMDSLVSDKQLGFSHRREDFLLRADPDKLQQIIVNLLSNAVKFTGAGGRIDIWCERHESTVSLHMRDSGRGIPHDKLLKIFDPFMQVDQRLAREHAGVGLGLAISRDLARAMNGDLTAVSVPGTGSTFTLTMPAVIHPQDTVM